MLGRRRIGSALLIAALVPACASVGLNPAETQTESFSTNGAAFVLEYQPQDTKAAQDVKVVLSAALPLLRRWGAFLAPVHIRIHASHAALEGAIFRPNYPWLRAWARYDSIDLQSPRTWSVLSAPLGQIAEVLTHELTHCLMYQHSATALTWQDKDIPLWFREGMASVTSHQEYRRPGDEAVWRYLEAHGGTDPVLDAERLYQAEPEIVYGAAHDAFAFLERRYGDRAIGKVLDAMRAGADFAPAFREGIGLDPGTFCREYLRYVHWEGWRYAPDAHVTRPLVAPPNAQ